MKRANCCDELCIAIDGSETVVVFRHGSRQRQDLKRVPTLQYCKGHLGVQA